ncbi:type II secretion system protein GspM [Thauera propionica]|uniref:type II secretion system protein GspM n=1 Tax=Thauera propionica TaxID=2019431 RepID=UPI0023F2195D|nr:type II secretion system protein GspM [Thauera propionica]MDD3675912.1 type II secretion system protein GspM [Thauera propionica]
MSFAPDERYRMLVRSLSLRERRALLAALALVVGAALLLGVESLLAERARLDRRLPQLAETLARMEIEAAELARLRATARKLAAADATLLAASARAHGLNAEIASDGGRGFRVGGQAALAALLPWLAELHAEYGLRVLEMDFDGAAGDRYAVTLGRDRD